MHVLGTRVPRRLGVARSASSPKAALALGCSLTPGLRISFGRVTCMARAASVPGLWALGFLLFACVGGWVRVAVGRGFCFHLPVVAGVLGVCVWARFVVLSLFCRLFVAFVVGLWCRPAFGTCVVSCALPLPPGVSGSGVRCGCACWVRVSAGPRPSWLGCRGVFFALFFFLLFVFFFFRLLGVPVPGLVVSPPVSFLFGWAAFFFFFFCGGLLVSVPLFPLGRCSWLGVAGFCWVVPLCLFGGPGFGALWVGGLASFCVFGGRFGGCGPFSRGPPFPGPLFFLGGGGGGLAVPPFAFPRLALALWLVCGVVGPSPLLAEVPVCYSPPLLAGFRCRWWWAVPATPGWGPLAVVVCGVWCVAVVCWWGCGWCVVWSVPRHSGRRFLCATPRHSWLGFAAAGGGRSPPLLAGVRWRRCCVVCRVWRWYVGGVVAGVWCGWSLATPGGGSCVLLPATPGWVSLPVVVGGPRHSWLGSACGGGVWCVVCGVWCVVVVCWWGWGWCVVCGGGVLLGLWFVCGLWRWCVVGVVAGVWCGWSLATPGGGPCVLLPATPGWVSLPLVVNGTRHSWLGSVGGGGVWCVVCGVLMGSLATPGGGSCVLLPATPGWVSLAAVVCGVWCVVCGGGVLLGLWLVCGVVGPSPLLAEVPVCYSPPLLAGFRCRWCWAVPATPGWGPLAAVVCGVWCVVCGGGVLLGLWLVCGVVGPSPLLAEVPVCYSPPLLAGFRCRWWWAVPATPGWGPLAAVFCGVWCVGGVPRHSWRRSLCATPCHPWLGFAAAGGGRSPPLLAGVRWRRWRVVCVRVRALLGRVGRAGLPGAFWCASPFPLAALSSCFAWPPPGRSCPSLFRCCCRSSLVVFLGLPLPGSPCAPASFVSPAWPLAALWWLLPRPPPLLCLAVFVAPAWCLGVFVFLFSSFLFFLCAPPLSPVFSGFRPQGPWASALALFALFAFRFWALRAFVALSCFPPGCWLLSRGCCPPPPSLCFAVFVPAARCCVPCGAVLPWVRCCAALLRVVSPGVLLSCAVLRSCGAAACCAVPFGAARRPGALCSAALCFAVFPRGVCSVLCVFCRGAVVRAVVRRSALCCVCLGLLCCAFPVLSVLCSAVLRCAGALVLCCSCGACCCWRLVLWCAAVCCAVSCGVPWCGAGSGGPWLSAGGVFRCRCPCLAAWCFPVVGMVCCGALLSCVVFCGAVLSRGAVLLCSAVVLRCCWGLLCPPVGCCAALCCAVGWLCCLWCGGGVCALWCCFPRAVRSLSSPLCALRCLVVLAVVPCFPVSCAVALCCRVVLCCRALLSFCGAVCVGFALLRPVVQRQCGLRCCWCLVLWRVLVRCCVSLGVLRCGGAALVCRGVLLCCALSCGVLRPVPCPAVPCCPAVLCCLFFLLSCFPLLKTPAVFPCL